MPGLSKTIVLLPGDGIGPEVIAAATAVLCDRAAAFHHRFTLREFPLGGAALDRAGAPLPPETLAACRAADAILLGAGGGPRRDGLPLGERPESGLLALRKELALYINLRPIRLREPLAALSPLKTAPARTIAFEIVRELAGGGPAPAAGLGGQGERAGHFRAVAEDGGAAGGRPPAGGAQPSLRRQRRHAAHSGSRAVRRHPHLEPVRRHFERRRGGSGGFHRPHPVDELRRRPALVRADPRLRAPPTAPSRGAWP